MKEHKIFKPYDRVLVRVSDTWSCDYYSHCSGQYHVTAGCGGVEDEYILPYEGNEHLVGTTDEPEIILVEGELLFYFAEMNNLEKKNLLLGPFDRTTDSLIKIKTQGVSKWEYAIRFSDFNPKDMEETKKHILCVKNGKVVRYKG